MSTASQLSHLPHTAHPFPLREQAFALHCQGLRSPAIATELGVSERTIRSWIAAALDDLKDDLQLNRREQVLLAVERQHQLTAVAWQQFEAEAAARDALLDAALETLLNAANSSSDAAGASTRPLHLHLPTSTPAPRYLSLILQANKETNRLLGLHTLATLQLLTPDVPETDPIPFTDSDIPAESATASPLATGCVGASAGRPQAPETPIPATTATAATLPLSAHGEGVGGEVPCPAESATASSVSACTLSSLSALNLRIPAESATGSPLSPQRVGALPAAPAELGMTSPTPSLEMASAPHRRGTPGCGC